MRRPVRVREPDLPVPPELQRALPVQALWVQAQAQPALREQDPELPARVPQERVPPEDSGLQKSLSSRRRPLRLASSARHSDRAPAMHPPSLRMPSACAP